MQKQTHCPPDAPPLSPSRGAAPLSPTPVAPALSSTTPRKISSRDLFSGSREIVIEHGERLYRMRITQNGKLILTA